MNERINELRLDAGIGRLNEVPYLVAVNKEGEIIDPLEGLQQFAELIVKECVKEMSQQMYWHRIDESNNPNFYKAVEKTLKHFGVE